MGGCPFMNSLLDFEGRSMYSTWIWDVVIPTFQAECDGIIESLRQRLVLYLGPFMRLGPRLGPRSRLRPNAQD